MNTKPGYLTTEFWLTLATAIFGGLVALGVLNKEQSDALLAIIVALIPAIVVAAYSISRARAKSGQ
jgi:uncharacterized membrane protein